MILSSFCKYYLLCALLIGNSTYSLPNPRHFHNSNSSTIFETIAAVGLVAAAAYGFYKVCDWLFTKTDEQVLHEAKICFSDVCGKTDKYIQAVKKGLGQFPESRKEQQKVIQDASEEFLYHFAVSKLYKIPGGHTFVDYAQMVADAGKIASKRANELRKKQLHEPIIGSLEKISDELGVLHTEIVFVAEFLREHSSYFNLFDFESRMLRAYEFEITSLENYTTNSVYVREALRMAVMKKAAYERISYPYMNYIEQLEKDVKNLKQLIDKLAYKYHNREKGAYLLLQQMETIYHIVVSEEAYRQELRDYKKEMLERERIAAEKAKADAAIAQAHAAHLQAQAMQQQAYELAKQNQLQQQQNQILINQTPTRVNVYV